MDTLSIESFVAKANAVGKVLNGDFDQVRRMIDNAEFVVAIWQDANEPSQVGMLIVKGESVLKEIVATGVQRELKWTAIPCTCAEQAVALQQVVDGANRH